MQLLPRNIHHCRLRCFHCLCARGICHTQANGGLQSLPFTQRGPDQQRTLCVHEESAWTDRSLAKSHPAPDVGNLEDLTLDFSQTVTQCCSEYDHTKMMSAGMNLTEVQNRKCSHATVQPCQMRKRGTCRRQQQANICRGRMPALVMAQSMAQPASKAWSHFPWQLNIT